MKISNQKYDDDYLANEYKKYIVFLLQNETSSNLSCNNFVSLIHNVHFIPTKLKMDSTSLRSLFNRLGKYKYSDEDFFFTQNDLLLHGIPDDERILEAILKFLLLSPTEQVSIYQELSNDLVRLYQNQIDGYYTKTEKALLTDYRSLSKGRKKLALDYIHCLYVGQQLPIPNDTDD